MSSLTGKKILLGVTGGIAAYKTPELVRLLKKTGADVHVVMTPAATRFVSPLTLGTVSEHPVLESVFPDNRDGSWTVHVHLARSADAMLIAPATANTLAKLATGMADTMLGALYLSLPATTPVFLAPSMDSDMWQHRATQDNLSLLKQRGAQIISPAEGALASGLSGPGRLPEPAELVEVLSGHFSTNRPLEGKQVVISAGPTREAIDPVRFISNHSSGKMGYALAEAARLAGAQVTLVSGPVALNPPDGVHLIRVETALEMKDAMESVFDKADLVLMAAAVADYRVESPSSKKIKRELTNDPVLKLIPNPDILKGLGQKKTNQFLVGFALETDDDVANARQKLISKHLDLVILNNPRVPGAGFNTDTNEVTLITHDDTQVISLAPKSVVARDILAYCTRKMKA
ncbi:MAG: bifunctional phosphopantothenoylcysteine decarboxylase/phosphopantothenate--cysteine ligase CoaBC [Bacteroidetes bacterium]|nr:bifunctional phosphopantothenoylcysteine decarboxylase/phosphopantothenate--cysteine ligase CoaBC [Bacteroidota bacterium]